MNEYQDIINNLYNLLKQQITKFLDIKNILYYTSILVNEISKFNLDKDLQKSIIIEVFRKYNYDYTLIESDLVQISNYIKDSLPKHLDLLLNYPYNRIEI